MSLRARAFTLVEVVVVLVVLAILVAVGAPRFAANQDRVDDGAVTMALGAFVADQDAAASARGRFEFYCGACGTPDAALKLLEPEFSYVASSSASTGPARMSVKTDTLAGYDMLTVSILSLSGRCFSIVHARQIPAAASVDDVRRSWIPDGSNPCTADKARSGVASAVSW